MQRGPWDGETVTIDGVAYTYTYTDDNNRSKAWTSGGESQDEDEEINVPYFVGDSIVAVEIRKNQVVDGFAVNEDKVRDSEDALISWVDLNVSGRAWIGPGAGSEECDPQSAIHDYTVIGSPEGGDFNLTLTVNGVNETLTFDYNANAAAVKAELVTHSQIGTDDVSVIGDFPDQTVRVAFAGDLAETPVLLPGS